ELESAKQFRADMNAAPAPEPTPNLLAASRVRLAEALETTQQNRGWRAWGFDPVDWLRQIRFSPALAAVMLSLGFAGGLLTAFRISNPGGNQLGSGPGPVVDQGSIAGIRGITQDPNTNTVQISYDRLLPASAQGPVDNPNIQEMLIYAIHTQQNP